MSYVSSIRVAYQCGHSHVATYERLVELLADFPVGPNDTWTTKGIFAIGYNGRDTIVLWSYNSCGWECHNNTPTYDLNILAADADDMSVTGDVTVVSSEDADATEVSMDEQDSQMVGACAPGDFTASGWIPRYVSPYPPIGPIDGGMATSSSLSVLEALGTGRATGRMGMGDAEYGVPRTGVGWRE